MACAESLRRSLYHQVLDVADSLIQIVQVDVDVFVCWETERSPRSRRLLVLEAHESGFCITCVLLLTFNRLKRLLKVEPDLDDQYVVALDFLREKRVEGLVLLNWDLLFDFLLIDFLGDLIEDG